MKQFMYKAQLSAIGSFQLGNVVPPYDVMINGDDDDDEEAHSRTCIHNMVTQNILYPFNTCSTMFS